MNSILNEHYGLTNCTFTKMEGYISTNYKVDSDQGRFVLKVYPPSEFEDVLAETAVIEELDYLKEHQISKPVRNREDQLLTSTEIDGEVKVLRLISFVEGQFLAEAEQSPALFRSIGNFVAKLDLKLLDFRNIGIEARRIDWDLQYTSKVRRFRHCLEDKNDLKLVDHFFLQWDEHVVPQIPFFRKSIIHNDANDWNLLVKEDKVTGIIDFGDSAHTALIFELAITLTYGLFGKDNPIPWAVEMIKGYHEELPLLEEEVDLLYYMVAARLVMGVCTTANEKRLQPDNEYILISEKPGWELLRKWLTINPRFAQNEFRKAAGFDPILPPPVHDMLQRRHQSLSPILSVSYDKPIHMESAVFQYMYNTEGNTFLDAYNNIPHVGHQHPHVVAAGQRQMAKLNTNTRYLYDPLHEYAEKLLSKFPDQLNKVYFVNSGSAASDLAIRLAQNFTGRSGAVVMEHGYHGNTRMGIEISQYKYASKGGKGKASHIIEAAIPDTYRGKYRDENAGLNYAQDLKAQIQDSDIELAAFIAEPIIGCGGQVPLAEGYLKEVYPFIREQGAVCISDEVQTGFGRMGSHFWGYQLHEVIPDIVVLGKPMGNGHPMGAVVTTEAIAGAFDNGMEFFSSFGGNPVSCAIGSAVLDVIHQEGLQQNSLDVGNYFMDELRKLQLDHACIGDVRGSGLFIGLELIKDDQMTPNSELAKLVKNELRNRHILVSTDGPHDSVIKSKPPLCFTKANVDEVVNQLNNVLRANT